MAMAQKRLEKELQELKEGDNSKFVRDVIVDEINILKWQFTLLPPNSPYNATSFLVEINFPKDYPFKVPELKFITPIYHPNVNKEGKVSFPFICPYENWNPTKKIKEVIKTLVDTLDSPDPIHVFDYGIIKEFNENRAEFNRKAEEHAKKNAGKR